MCHLSFGYAGILFSKSHRGPSSNLKDPSEHRDEISLVHSRSWRLPRIAHLSLAISIKVPYAIVIYCLSSVEKTKFFCVMNLVFYLKFHVDWVQDFLLRVWASGRNLPGDSGVKLHRSSYNAEFDDRTFAFL